MTGGVSGALFAFAVAAAVIVLLMLTLATLVVGATATAVDAVRFVSPTIRRWGGTLMGIAGAWLIFLAFAPRSTVEFLLP